MGTNEAKKVEWMKIENRQEKSGAFEEVFVNQRPSWTN